MHGRPKLGKHRMVTVATRVEPAEVQKLRNLAEDCGMSLCGYMREMIRVELGRADRNKKTQTKGDQGLLNGATGICDIAV